MAIGEAVVYRVFVPENKSDDTEQDYSDGFRDALPLDSQKHVGSKYNCYHRHCDPEGGVTYHNNGNI